MQSCFPKLQLSWEGQTTTWLVKKREKRKKESVPFEQVNMSPEQKQSLNIDTMTETRKSLCREESILICDK